MLLIIAHHYVVNSGLTAADGPIYSDQMSWRALFLLILGAFGKTGINCFVLITGYFMCRSQITMKKFCKILFEVMFYKIGIWSIFLISGYEAFTLKGLLKTLLPFTEFSTNFIGCYLAFYLFIPFLNILVRYLSERQHIILVLLCSYLYVFVGTMPKFNVTMNYVSWFIVLYFIGSYIRIYDKKIFSNTKFWGICTLSMLLISVASIVGMIFVFGGSSDYFLVDSNKAFAVMLAFSSFMFFKNLKIKNNKFINATASTAFGVLLIHANSDTMRKWLWQDVLDNVGMYDSKWIPLHAIGSVIVIYIVCACIDYLRILFLEKPFFKLWDKYFDTVKVKYVTLESKLCNKFNIQS